MAERRFLGATLLEALLAILILSVVVPGAWKVFAIQRNAGALMAHRAEGLETVRTVAWVLSEEVSSGRPGLDWETGGSDTLALRAFRGQGLVDHSGSLGPVLNICFWGDRNPIPEKDSVLLLGKDGRWTVHDLQERLEISTGCLGEAGGTEERWTLSPDAPASVLARLFEKGSYHFSAGALRYRRGDGGRQPLTPERISHGIFLGPAEGGNPFAWELVIRDPIPRTDSVVASISAVWRGRDE